LQGNGQRGDDVAVLKSDSVFLGASDEPQYLRLDLTNRHGLITGATGTGKTVSLQIIAEGLANAGVPVFCADVKGDLAGLAAAGDQKPFLVERAQKIGFADEYKPEAFPTVFWDIFAEKGHPVRATVSEMGPLLLSRLLGLNETQEGVLNIVFRVADEEGLLLLDLKDLQSLLVYVADNAAQLGTRFGNVAKPTVGAIQRALLVLENQGGGKFFGEPQFQVADLMRTTRDGRGMVSIMAADKLMASPRVYSTFLLWLLSELFEDLPEIGDPEKPRLVFFFDEAHMLFDDAPKALVEKVVQVVRMIRSKGVGVYFVTQNPLDIPEDVLAQLGNRIQHALRAYTPTEMKAVTAAAKSFRPNPSFDTAEAIGTLAVGEALVSTLGDKGVPSIVQKTLIRPPSSRLGTITDAERQSVILADPIGAIYDKTVDRESAFEMLAARVSAREPAQQPDPPARQTQTGGTQTTPRQGGGGMLDTIFGTNRPRGKRLTQGQRVAREVTRTVSNRVAGSVAADIGNAIGGSMGRSVGRAIVRGMLGGILR
jgi:DNA helicase HerA-like ATPase